MSRQNHNHVVILAGGEGTRFVPLSTPEKPKQFLAILDPEKTLLQQTVDRVRGLVPDDHLYVSTNRRYLPLVRNQLPDMDVTNVLGEPVKKNTAPPMALITRLILERDPEAVLLFLPSDHFIARMDGAREAYAKALAVAATEKALVTFGVLPTFPSTQYGYIRRDGESPGVMGAFRVRSFVEKPDEETARRYLESGNYFWNSGQFAWRGSHFLEELKRSMPPLHALLISLDVRGGKMGTESIDRFFQEAQGISIDYGIMEKADAVFGIPFDVGWSDVGTWEGLADLARRHHLSLNPEVRRLLDSR